MRRINTRLEKLEEVAGPTNPGSAFRVVQVSLCERGGDWPERRERYRQELIPLLTDNDPRPLYLFEWEGAPCDCDCPACSGEVDWPEQLGLEELVGDTGAGPLDEKAADALG